jgi:hypothetical protein
MNRLLICTAVGLFLGLTPVLAENEYPANDAPSMPSPAQRDDPSAMDAPAQPAELPPAPDQSSQEGPQAISPAAARTGQVTAPNPTAQFLIDQKSDDWLASNLIGESVVNADDETIGNINDLVTDHNGKVVAVLIGTGGFLGIGEKHVGVRFEDLKLVRNEDDRVKIVLNVNKDALASAPIYQTLDQQQVSVGANKSDREENSTPHAY